MKCGGDSRGAKVYFCVTILRTIYTIICEAKNDCLGRGPGGGDLSVLLFVKDPAPRLGARLNPPFGKDPHLVNETCDEGLGGGGGRDKIEFRGQYRWTFQQ